MSTEQPKGPSAIEEDDRILSFDRLVRMRDYVDAGHYMNGGPVEMLLDHIEAIGGMDACDRTVPAASAPPVTSEQEGRDVLSALRSEVVAQAVGWQARNKLARVDALNWVLDKIDALASAPSPSSSTEGDHA